MKGKYIVKIIAMGDRIWLQEILYSFFQTEHSLLSEQTNRYHWYNGFCYTFSLLAKIPSSVGFHIFLNIRPSFNTFLKTEDLHMLVVILLVTI